MTGFDYMIRLFGIVLLSAMLQACSQQIQPDLQRLYQQSQSTQQPPVILIHGIMGARLSDTARWNCWTTGSFSWLSPASRGLGR